MFSGKSALSNARQFNKEISKVHALNICLLSTPNKNLNHTALFSHVRLQLQKTYLHFGDMHGFITKKSFTSAEKHRASRNDRTARCIYYALSCSSNCYRVVILTPDHYQRSAL